MNEIQSQIIGTLALDELNLPDALYAMIENHGVDTVMEILDELRDRGVFELKSGAYYLATDWQDKLGIKNR